MAPQLWYIRRGTLVQGPFPRGLIVRYVVLGRIGDADELSADLENWLPLAELPELVPAVVIEDGERLTAMQRWESERVAVRRETAAVELDRRDEDRRTQDDNVPRPVLRHDDPGEIEARRRCLRRIVAGIALGALLAMALALIFHRAPSPPATADCTAPPQPGVVWNSCDLAGRLLARSDLSGARMNSVSLAGAELREARLEGADLAFANLNMAGLRGADLRGARLMGASLRGAALDGARFDGADLSYADLRGARLNDVSLRGARLDSALWVDGSTCAAGSTGACRVAGEAGGDSNVKPEAAGNAGGN